jgi:ubiquinone/menaquinone biosynthesis C-methylase UbiE
MGKIGDFIFSRNHRLCPRWMCFTFDNGLRRLVQNPEKIVSRYIRAGDTVLDIGPGIGYFTIPLAKLIGDHGRVIAVDIQPSMLEGIRKRARRAGVADRVILHLASDVSLNITVKADFILAFWMAHEVPDQESFFAQLYAALKENGKFLLAEPRLHVSKGQFDTAISLAQKVGFRLINQPDIPLSLAALLGKL